MVANEQQRKKQARMSRIFCPVARKNPGELRSRFYNSRGSIFPGRMENDCIRLFWKPRRSEGRPPLEFDAGRRNNRDGRAPGPRNRATRPVGSLFPGRYDWKQLALPSDLVSSLSASSPGRRPLAAVIIRLNLRAFVLLRPRRFIGGPCRGILFTPSRLVICVLIGVSRDFISYSLRTFQGV